MKSDPVYADYWKRKRILAGPIPHSRVARWWPSTQLTEIERFIFARLRGAASLLDVGAGDLSTKKKFQAAGFSGIYETVDIGTGFDYDYSDVFSVNKKFGAVLFQDVLEHLDLQTGLRTLSHLSTLLENNGVLVIQTTNSRCIRSSESKDMTHLHSYNLPDLTAYLIGLGFEVEGFRVVFQSSESPGIPERLKSVIGKWVITRLLGSDYADNIVAIARKTARSIPLP